MTLTKPFNHDKLIELSETTENRMTKMKTVASCNNKKKNFEKSKKSC